MVGKIYNTANITASKMYPSSNTYISKYFYESIYPSLVEPLNKSLFECMEHMRDCKQTRSELLAAAIVYTKICRRLNWYSEDNKDIPGYLKPNVISKTYEVDFEKPYLKHLEEYYIATGTKWASTMTVPDFMHAVETEEQHEFTRVNRYMRNIISKQDREEGIIPTWTRARKVFYIALLFKQQSFIYEHETTGLRHLFKTENYAAISEIMRIYMNASDILHDSLTHIAALYHRYLIEQAMKIVRTYQSTADGNSNADATFVHDMSNIHDWSHQFVETTFKSAVQFRKAHSDAFSEIMNLETGVREGNSLAEVLAGHLDGLLQGKGQKTTDDKREDSVMKSIMLFRYIRDKDIFGEVYRQQLAKRLVNNKSISSDLERSVLTRLKTECGVSFTAKLEGMMNDMAIASNKDFANEYTEYYRSVVKGTSPVDFNALVLTQGFWPAFSNISGHLPPEVTAHQEAYTKFYDTKFSRRKLVWCLTAGSAQIKATFGRTTYEFTVTPLQAIIMYAFNSITQPVTMTDVCTMTGMDSGVVRPMLHSLSCGKIRILSKTPATNTIKDDDTFIVNEGFTSQMKRMRIPAPSVTDAATSTREKVDEGRVAMVEAAVVRIMKAQKQLGHQELIATVLEQLHTFKPAPKLIKSRIESLIEREYLERDEENSGTYKYLA